MGVATELDLARQQLLEDRAKESRRRLVVLVVYLAGAALIAIGLGLYYLRPANIPDWLGWMSFALAAGDLLAMVLALRGNRVAAGVLAQLLPVVPVLIAAHAFSADAGFGSYLFIGALGVMVTIPEGHTAARVVCVSILVAAIVVIQVFFTRAEATVPLSFEQTTALNTFNRTVMTVALFALALELTRSTRAGRRLVDQSLRIAELLATTDPLTGIANRRPVWERLESAARDGEVVTVGVADMDHFKELNDANGHDCGDDALRDLDPKHLDVVLTLPVRAADEPETTPRFGRDLAPFVLAQYLDELVDTLTREDQADQLQQLTASA